MLTEAKYTITTGEKANQFSRELHRLVDMAANETHDKFKDLIGSIGG